MILPRCKSTHEDTVLTMFKQIHLRSLKRLSGVSHHLVYKATQLGESTYPRIRQPATHQADEQQIPLLRWFGLNASWLLLPRSWIFCPPIPSQWGSSYGRPTPAAYGLRQVRPNSATGAPGPSPSITAAILWLDRHALNHTLYISF